MTTEPIHSSLSRLFPEPAYVLQMQHTLRRLSDRKRIELPSFRSNATKAEQRVHWLQRVPAPRQPRYAASHEERVRSSVLDTLREQRGARLLHRRAGSCVEKLQAGQRVHEAVAMRTKGQRVPIGQNRDDQASHTRQKDEHLSVRLFAENLAT